MYVRLRWPLRAKDEEELALVFKIQLVDLCGSSAERHSEPTYCFCTITTMTSWRPRISYGAHTKRKEPFHRASVIVDQATPKRQHPGLAASGMDHASAFARDRPWEICGPGSICASVRNLIRGEPSESKKFRMVTRGQGTSRRFILIVEIHLRKPSLLSLRAPRIPWGSHTAKPIRPLTSTIALTPRGQRFDRALG